MIEYMLAGIALILVTIGILLINIRWLLVEIKFHLNGIETKEITSLGDEPRIFTRSDEDEYNISQARKPKPEEE